MVMLPNVARAIDRFSVKVTLSTSSPGVYVDGIYQGNNTSDSSIMAAIQPATGNQLMDVPEGLRTEARWLCWSRSIMKVDDIITHDGIKYRVVFDWPRNEGGFYRAAIGRMVK